MTPIFRLIALNLLILFFVKQYFANELHHKKRAYAYHVIESHLYRLAKSIDSHSVVFLGSSSVQGMDVGNIVNGAMNLGIGGERISQLDKRIRSYSNLSKARALVFMAGFNDVCKGVNLAYQQFSKMIQVAKGQSIVIVSIQPAISQSVCPQLSQKTQDYNLLLNSYCHNTENCHYVNFAKNLKLKAQDEESLLAYFFEEDGIHLNAKGYDILEEDIRSSLEKAF